VAAPVKAKVEKHHHASRELVYYLNMITRLALGTIAAYTSALLFLPSFFIGMVLGMRHHHYSNRMTAHEHGHEIVGCGQGFMESMADMHFPDEISLLANLGVTICHLDHHPLVFVPYAGVAVGMWAGQLLDKQLTHFFRWYHSEATQSEVVMV
jgi:hypothetical protein